MTWVSGVAGCVWCIPATLIVEGNNMFTSVARPSCLCWIAAVGYGGYCAQSSFNWGAQFCSATLNSMLRYLDVVFSLIWQVTIFHEQLTMQSATCVVVVFVSV